MRFSSKNWVWLVVDTGSLGVSVLQDALSDHFGTIPHEVDVIVERTLQIIKWIRFAAWQRTQSGAADGAENLCYGGSG